MQPGDVVKFAKPTSVAEAAVWFVVIELRGRMVLVEYVCSMRIRPTLIYAASDLVPDETKASSA